MKKIKSLILVYSFIILSYSSFSQTILNGIRADKIIKGAEMVRINDNTGVPTYIKFRKGSEISYDKLNGFITNVIKPTSEFGMKLISTEKDNLGNVNYRYYQTYQSYTIQDGMFIVHVRDGKIFSINGDISKQISLGNNVSLTEEAALQQALSQINADKYKWQIPEEEQFIKKDRKDPKATYYPKGEVELYYDKTSRKYYYTYRFDIYAAKPLMRADVYVNASNGKILFKNSKIHFADVPGTAVTKYSGTRSITTDSVSTTDYILSETQRGGGLETYNMLTTTNYSSAVDFHDTDNNWNNVNTAKDEVATDAHWGAEKTYDFYMTKYNRNSLDGNGMKINSYVHYDVSYANAFWDGSEMNYGDGSTSSGMGPLTAIDICGHEMTHGVTSFTANLNYQDESGAMNEGFSDVMGTAIKFYAKPPQNSTWEMGADIGTVIRDMSNPKAYQQPNTYNGTYWYTGTADNGGVHTNSGVLNFWYYLLCHGGSGTNDISNTYSVIGIGMDTATNIAYRTLTTYLVPSSQYADARFYAIQSANDLYGACSPAVISTTDAWYAVGIGAAFVPGVTSNFISNGASYCSIPVTVNFTNQSNNCTNFNWDFGDGSYSNTMNPSHVYNTYGTFNVKLVSSGGCGTDSISKDSVVIIQPVTSPALSFTDTTFCGSASFTITATPYGGGSISWYNSPTSTTPIDTGSVYTTPVLTSPKIYYAEMTENKPSLFGGKLDSLGGTFSNYTQNYQRGEIFDCYAEAKLVSVLVWATGAGNRTIQLWNTNDSIIWSGTFNIPAGKSRVYLNLDLPVMNNLKLYGPATPNLYRSSMGTSSTSYPYPYNIGNLVSITASTITQPSGNPTNFYYYFYDWEVKSFPPCKSLRIPVNINVNDSLPTAAFNYTSGNGQFANTTVHAVSYHWDFGDGSSSTLANPVHLYSTNGTYYVKLTGSNPCGSDSITQTIVITDASVQENNFFKDFNIYPNPTNQSINITLTSATSTNAGLIIYDLLGKTVYNENVTINTTEYIHKVDVSNLEKGVYFLTLKANNTTISRKLIVY